MIIRCNTYKKRRATKTLLFYVNFFSASYLMKILYENLFHVPLFLVLLLLENQGLILNGLFSLFYSLHSPPKITFYLRVKTIQHISLNRRSLLCYSRVCFSLMSHRRFATPLSKAASDVFPICLSA